MQVGIDTGGSFWNRSNSTRGLASKSMFFYLASYCWLLAGWALARAADNGQLWVPLVGGLILGLPFFVTRLYLTTINKTFHTHQFRKKSFLRAFWSGRFFPTIFWLIVSLVSGVWLIYWFRLLTLPEWGVLCVSVPILRFLFFWMAARAKGQYQEYLVFAKGLVLAKWSFVVILTLVWVAINILFFPVEDAPLLSEVMLEQHKVLLSPEQSVIAQLLNRYSVYYDSASALGVQFLSGEAGIFYQLTVVFFFLFALVSFPFAISAFLIPAKECQRILTPLTEGPVAPGISVERSSNFAAIVTIILIFIYPVAGIYLENTVRERIGNGEVDRFEMALQPHLEEFEGRYFKAGTIKAMDQLRAGLLNEQMVGKQEVEQQLDAAYGAMSENIDTYLDEYYSLPAEYLRIRAALTSSLEAHIQRELRKVLGKGQPFSQFERTAAAFAVQHELALEDFEAKKSQLLSENEVVSPVDDFWVVSEISPEQFHPPAPDTEYLDVAMRAYGSAGAGAVSSVVAGKVAAKVAAKGTLKLAATAVSKAATSKAGAGGASALAGAALGSIFPGLGTAFGAAIGFGVGVVVGISVDAAMLSIEEFLAREEFKLEILSALSAAKAEHKRQLGL